MIHLDDKRHGRIVINFSGTIIASKSFKKKLVTKSSIESEMVAVEECAIFIIDARPLQYLILDAQNHIYVMQDKLSGIGIINNGGSFHRSKHMIAQHGLVKQLSN